MSSSDSDSEVLRLSESVKSVSEVHLSQIMLLRGITFIIFGLLSVYFSVRDCFSSSPLLVL